MTTPEDAKAYADKLTKIMNDLGYNISRGHALEVVARFNDYKDWNTYLASLSGKAELLPVPEGWQMGGDNIALFEYGLDPSEKINGAHPMLIRKKPDAEMIGNGYATCMQSCDAINYVNQRVRFKADLKAKNCTGAVTIWLRADSQITGQHVAFANMESRVDNGPLCDTTKWETRDIVLDIPKGAVSLNYGFYVRGEGTGYGADFSLERVSKDVALTDGQPNVLKKPFNLKFWK